MSESSRGRGRPAMVDVVDLRTMALDILLARGYQNVTMSELAAEAGISVRTLHRYFPGKADIVWGGLEGALEALRGAFEKVDERLPALEAVTQAMVTVFAEEAEEATFGRSRLRVLASTPALEVTRPEIYRLWRQETVAFIARRLDMAPDDIVPLAVGAAIQTTIMEALAWWAARDVRDTPADIVAHALHGLESIAKQRDGEPTGDSLRGQTLPYE